MNAKDFRALLERLPELTRVQRRRLTAALETVGPVEQVAAIVDPIPAAERECPYCGTVGMIGWGESAGIRRYRCRSCARTSSALSNTPLVRLRRKSAWLDYAEAVGRGMSVRRAADHCGVHYTTAFRWRHRFLPMPSGMKADHFEGIVEADETFFLESFKGARVFPIDRAPRKRGGVAKKRGLSFEQIPVLVVRDRNGATTDTVLPSLRARDIVPALSGLIARDAVLCTDKARAYQTFARATGIRHERITSKKGERVRGAFHIQNVNGYHSRLKDWMRRFRGVSTKYLPNYLGWRRLLDRFNSELNAETILASSVGFEPTNS